MKTESAEFWTARMARHTLFEVRFFLVYKIGNLLISISPYRERVIHPLFAILEILPTYSPYNAVVGVVLSQK